MISKTVETFLEKYNLQNSNILVAFSGGYDSMCLLDVLKKLSNKYHLNITAIHLNHNWRGKESDFEEENCKKFCSDVNFYCEKLADNVPHTETAAREARYEFFNRCAKKFNSEVIFTAHNANDNAETIFYRLIKGTGLTGLEGIPEKRDIFYRPILTIYRDEIEAYCIKENLTPNNDSSNKDSKYARNKIRNEIFPELKKIMPEFEKNLNKLSKSAQFANSQIEKFIKPLEKYNTSGFIELSCDLQNAVVHQFLRSENIDYDSRKIADIVLFIQNSKNSKAGKTLSLTTNKWLFVNNEKIQLVNKTGNKLPEIEITQNGTYRIGNYEFSIQPCKENPKEFPSDKENIAYISLENYENLTIRGRKDGDIIQPLGMFGSQKLKKYLNEKKIPKHEKDNIVFLCKDKEILWAAGLGISEKIKVVSKPTHVIKLKREA